MRFLTLRKRFAVWKVDKWWLPFLATLLILLTLLGTEYTSAHRQQVMASSVQLPVAGQLYCIPGSTCEHILPNVTTMTIPEHVGNTTQLTEVDIMMTQEWKDTYKMGVPIPSRVGPKGVHHALNSPKYYNSICQIYMQLCTTEITRSIKGAISTFNDFYSCAGQKSPIATSPSTGNAATLPLAYRPALTRKQKILLTAFIAIAFVVGATNDLIFKGAIKSKFATIQAGGLAYLASGLIFAYLGALMDVAQRENNAYGIPEAMKALAISAWLVLSNPIKNLFSGANAQCVATAQTAAAQELCPYPFPPPYTQAEGEMCYPDEPAYGLKN